MSIITPVRTIIKSPASSVFGGDGAGNPPAPFNPLDIPGIRGWWDATDVTSFTLNAGYVVSWRDKFASIPFSQAVQANQPSYSSNEVTFGTTNKWHLTAETNYIFSPSTHSGYSIVVRAKPAVGATVPFLFDFGGYAGADVFIQFRQSSLITGAGMENLGEGTAPPLSYIASIAPVYHTICYNIKFTKVSPFVEGVETLYLDNVKVAETTGISKTAITTLGIWETDTRQISTGPMCLGLQAKTGNDTNRWYDGTIRSFFVFDEWLSDTYRNKLNNYLATI